MSIEINRSIDIEEVVQSVLSEYMTAYCPPLPASYDLPFVRITGVGGSEADTIDTFTVTIEGYASTDAAACEITRNAAGVLKAAAKDQDTEIRNVVENTKAQYYADPLRPDLSRYQTTLIITAHQETTTLT